MDLHTWLIEAHRDARARLMGAVVSKVPTDRWAEQADGGGSSLTWILLHTARHHDLALNTAIRNGSPLFASHREALGLTSAGASVGLAEREHEATTALVSPDALKQYLTEVLDAGDEWLADLSIQALDTVPDTERRLLTLAHIDPVAYDWLVAMWNTRPVHWLVQWPMLGHLHSHIGEAIAVRNRLGYNPF